MKIIKINGVKVKAFIHKFILKQLLKAIEKDNRNKAYKWLNILKFIHKEQYFKLKKEYLDYFYYNGEKVLKESLKDILEESLWKK